MPEEALPDDVDLVQRLMLRTMERDEKRLSEQEREIEILKLEADLALLDFDDMEREKNAVLIGAGAALLAYLVTRK